MDGLGERARRAEERRRYAAEAEYLRLADPAAPSVQAAGFVRRGVWERFRVSGRDVRVEWLRAPPRGSVAQLVLEGEHRVVCIVERQPVGLPRCRFWLDGWPGAVEVYDLADLAQLPDRVAA